MPTLPDSFEIRVAVCARRPLPILAALDRPGLAVCDVQADFACLCGRLEALSPHVLVLAGAEGDLSPLRALPCPPRVVEAEGQDLARRVREAMRPPVSALAEPSMPRRLDAAERLLIQLGMPRTLGGFEALRLGAAWLSALPAPYPPAQYWLYPLLGERLGVSSAAVERRIRSAIESAWLYGSWEAQSALLGASVSPSRGKPTNSELLCLLAERVRP